jgi:MurE/MurF fusion protein
LLRRSGRRGEKDLVLIAGKGHEPYQLTAAGKRFFSDRLAAAEVLCQWTAPQVALATEGRLIAGSGVPRLLGQVFTDSRRPCPEGIFVALRGDSHDGHDYLAQAITAGAACLVVERPFALPAGPVPSQVVVADTLRALGDLAAYRRRQLAAFGHQLVLAITGSCGKTTVKEMTAAILARLWPEGADHPPGVVLKTSGNFNNLIGLPLSLLPLGVHHRAAVLEMGMNRPGELRRLGEIARPEVSCITNIHAAHLEELRTIEGVAQAKEELFAATDPAGILIVNLDDPRVVAAAARYPQRRVFFSRKREEGDVKADFWASELSPAADDGQTFVLHHGQRQTAVRLHTVGEHNVSNALAAAAIASAAGAGLAEIAAGLADFRPKDKRMVLERGRDGLVLLNDCYNANPASMASGLRTLKQLAGGRKSVALIGDMLELGSTSAAAHAEIGRLVAELALDYVGVVGNFREDVVRGAVAAGFSPARIRPLASKDAAGEWLERMLAEKILGRDDLVLVKASRGLRFETIVARLLAKDRGKPS